MLWYSNFSPYSRAIPGRESLNDSLKINTLTQSSSGFGWVILQKVHSPFPKISSFPDADYGMAAASQDNKAQRTVNGKLKTEIENEGARVWVSAKLMRPMRGQREPVEDNEREKKNETWRMKNSFHSSFNSLSAELRKKQEKCGSNE